MDPSAYSRTRSAPDSGRDAKYCGTTLDQRMCGVMRVTGSLEYEIHLGFADSAASIRKTGEAAENVSHIASDRLSVLSFPLLRQVVWC